MLGLSTKFNFCSHTVHKMNIHNKVKKKKNSYISLNQVCNLGWKQFILGVRARLFLAAQILVLWEPWFMYRMSILDPSAEHTQKMDE